MLRETATSHEGAPNFKVILTPSPGSNNVEGSPFSPSVELGPLATSFDMSNGWIVDQLDPITIESVKEVSPFSLSGQN